MGEMHISIRHEKLLIYLNPIDFQGGNSRKKNHRYWLIDQLSSNPFFDKPYDYHLNGLDVMSSQPEAGKQAIAKVFRIKDLV